jgi:rubrerythrin
MAKNEPISPGVRAALETCREIELGCARLYEAYAQAYRADGPLSALWVKTASEELNHAEQIALVIRSMGDAVAGASFDAKQAELKLAKVRSLLRDAVARPPSPAEAVRKALELERELDAFHAGNAATFKDPSTRKLLQAMQAADKGHVAQLEKALALLSPG